MFKIAAKGKSEVGEQAREKKKKKQNTFSFSMFNRLRNLQMVQANGKPMVHKIQKPFC